MGVVPSARLAVLDTGRDKHSGSSHDLGRPQTKAAAGVLAPKVSMVDTAGFGWRDCLQASHILWRIQGCLVPKHQETPG